MLKYIPANAQHIGARHEQQDSFAFSDPADTSFVAHGGLLGMIADGMGGLEGGRQASSAAVAAFLAAYSRKTPAEQIPAALTRSLSEANAAVKSVAHQMGTEESTGTTLIAGVIHNTSLYWISAGDSRMYVLRHGRLARINADHTYGADLWPEVAAGRMDRQQALTDPQAPHLTSYLGLPEVPSYDLSLRPFPLEPDDVFLACTDGVYRSIGEEEMASAFRSAPPGPACDAIKAATLAKNNPQQDNLTVIAIQLRDSGDSVRVPERPAAAVPVTAVEPPPKRHGRAMITVFSLEALLALGMGLYVVHPWGVHQPVSAGTKSPGPATKPAAGGSAGGTQDEKPKPKTPLVTGSGSATQDTPQPHGAVQPGTQGQSSLPPPAHNPHGGSAGPEVIPLPKPALHAQPGNGPKNPGSDGSHSQGGTTPSPHNDTTPPQQGLSPSQEPGQGPQTPPINTNPPAPPPDSPPGNSTPNKAPPTPPKPPQSGDKKHTKSNAKGKSKNDTKPAPQTQQNPQNSDSQNEMP